jgi:hypothetical protein
MSIEKKEQDDEPEEEIKRRKKKKVEEADKEEIKEIQIFDRKEFSPSFIDLLYGEEFEEDQTTNPHDYSTVFRNARWWIQPSDMFSNASIYSLAFKFLIERVARRWGHSAQIIGNNLYIFGGSGTADRIYKHTFELNLSTFQWKTTRTSGTPPAPRDSHSSLCVITTQFKFF